MIERCQGNLLEADAEALVNTVNCVGIMGKGIALAFKKKFDKNFKAYEQACEDGLVMPGRMFIVPTGTLWNPRYIINFPTKRHWKSKSKLSDVEAGLEALVADVRSLGIQSIAVPPLGCGHGGLDWHLVAPMIEGAFEELPQVHVLLYEPATPAPPLMLETKMSLGRAMLLSLMATRPSTDGRHDLAEIQLLAYLIQISGQPLRLTFKWQASRPWADTLGRVLCDMEGTFIQGSGDDEGGIRLLPGAATAADAFLNGAIASQKRVESLQGLLSGMKGQDDLSLLGQILWAAKQDETVREAPEAAIAFITNHTVSQETYAASQIRNVWALLRESGCLAGDSP